MPDTTLPTAERELRSRTQNTVAQATEFGVTTDWAPMLGKPDTGGLHTEYFTDLQQAEEVFREYEIGEYPRARAVCIFASRHGIPIGRLL